MTLALSRFNKTARVVKTRSNSDAYYDDGQTVSGVDIDLPAEADLDPSIYPAKTHRATSRLRYGDAVYAPRRAFLTGGTGYLGAFLMWELAFVQRMPTYALVRAKDEASAVARLVDTLKKYERASARAKRAQRRWSCCVLLARAMGAQRRWSCCVLLARAKGAQFSK